MNSGVSNMRRGFLLCTVLLIGPIVASGAEKTLPHGDHSRNGWTIEQLVALINEERTSSVLFVETTYSSLLTEPLVSRGVLRFLPPSTLEKEVLSPYRERYLIEGDRVTFESERKQLKRAISLEDYPALRSFVDAFRATLTGDAVRLKHTYETRLDGDRRKWWLLLQPHESVEPSMVEQILISGSEGRIARITVRSTGGDRSVMTLSGGHAP
jgi:hypothetical protein